MQTASGLPKKSLEERKVSSEGGRSKALGGKKVLNTQVKASKIAEYQEELSD
jgi:hypothetical protein